MEKTYTVIYFVNHATKQFSLSKRLGFPISTITAISDKESKRGYVMFIIATNIDDTHAKTLVTGMRHDMEVAGYKYETREALEKGPY